MLCTLQFFTLVALMAAANGFCFAGESTKRADGTVVCQVEGHVMKPGDEINDEEKCISCRCSETMYSCCGVGYNAGVIAPPENFTLVKDDNCQFHFEPVG